MRKQDWHWWGLAAGLVLGAVDLSTFFLFGAIMQIGGVDVTVPFSLFFWATFGALGFVVGRLAQARDRARADAATIQTQLRTLEATQRAALHNEKLAAIGRLAAGVAHEVRNPLGVIRASASMLQEGMPAGEESHRACVFIQEEIDRLDALITALLGFARPTEPRLQTVAPEKLVDRALQLAAPELEQRGIALQREVDATLVAVRADPDLLSQVIYDLVLNAAQALGRDGRIAVRAAGAQGALHLEVADSGPGVAPEHAQDVFEPFFTTRASGTGLGLAMAARIVQAHGGEIQLQPDAGLGPGGRGACFRVCLTPTGLPAATP